MGEQFNAAAHADDLASTGWPDRVEDFRRHLVDLQENSYEGSQSPREKTAAFQLACTLLEPTVRQVLHHFNTRYLAGQGRVTRTDDEDHPRLGRVVTWSLDWEELTQLEARDHVGRRLPPLRIAAIFPSGWTHGHLCLLDGAPEPEVALACWPMQVKSPTDAARQVPVLWAILEAELHDRIYQVGQHAVAAGVSPLPEE